MMTNPNEVTTTTVVAATTAATEDDNDIAVAVAMVTTATAPPPFVVRVGQFVAVASRTQPGMNQLGGIGRITSMSQHQHDVDVRPPNERKTTTTTALASASPVQEARSDQGNVVVSIKYVLDGRQEKNVDLIYIQPYTYDNNDDGVDTAGSSCNSQRITNESSTSGDGKVVQPHSSVLYQQRQRRHLRDRTMLLGRCQYCGSLRTDCQSCDRRMMILQLQQKQEMQYTANHQRNATLSRDAPTSNVTTSISYREKDDDDDDDDHSTSTSSSNRSERSQEQYERLIQQHRREYMKYKRYVRRIQQQQQQETQQHSDTKTANLHKNTTATTQRNVHQTSSSQRQQSNVRRSSNCHDAPSTKAKPNRLHAPMSVLAAVTTTIDEEEDTITTTNFDDEVDDEVVYETTIHLNSNNETTTTNTQTPMDTIVVSTSLNHEAKSKNDSDRRSRLQSDSSSSDEDDDDDQFLNQLSLHQLAAIQQHRLQQSSKPFLDDTRQSTKIVAKQKTRPPNANVLDNLTLFNAASKVQDRYKSLSANNERDSANLDTANNMNLTQTFIQPEGDADRLPQDVYDITNTISYPELIPFVHDTIRRIERMDIPYAQQQLQQLERDIHTFESDETNATAQVAMATNTTQTAMELLQTWYV
jgi:hypothetical protein